MLEFEASQGRREPVSHTYSQVSAINPEWVGISSDDAKKAMHETRSLTQAKEFVSGYLQGVAENISQEFQDIAPALTKRHLIDLLYINYPANNKFDHPSHRSSYLIVEAMMELLPPDEDLIDTVHESMYEMPSQDKAYKEIVARLRSRQIVVKKRAMTA